MSALSCPTPPLPPVTVTPFKTMRLWNILTETEITQHQGLSDMQM